MLSKFEIIGISASVLCMAAALYLVRVETELLTTVQNNSQVAAVAQQSDIITVASSDDVNQARASALREASDVRGNLNKIVIDDIKPGTGAEVAEGDTVVVHYIGTLQDGFEFDNSNKRGEPFEFTVGEGRVIAGWEEGLLGMKVGGQRVLVIPPDKAYGNRAIGSIPANSTLVFAIELLEIK